MEGDRACDTAHNIKNRERSAEFQAKITVSDPHQIIFHFIGEKGHADRVKIIHWTLASCRQPVKFSAF